MINSSSMIVLWQSGVSVFYPELSGRRLYLTCNLFPKYNQIYNAAVMSK